MTDDRTIAKPANGTAASVNWSTAAAADNAFLEETYPVMLD
ncbi:MAG: hypothetical protein ACOYEL_00530 [Saccharofermentanales bacterium]